MPRMAPTQSEEPGDAEKLLIASARGDRTAFTALYRLASARLFGVCMVMLGERSEAEDALQEVFISVWRHAQSFDPARASAMTWLVTLARNRCIDRLRQRRPAELDDTFLHGLADERPTPGASAESSQERHRLERCLDQLEGNQKAAVRAAFFTGATYNELAQRCGVPLATMKSWIRRSLVKLRICLDRSV